MLGACSGSTKKDANTKTSKVRSRVCSMREKVGRDIYRTKRWAIVRLQILKRDGFRCQQCGSVGRLEVDHINPIPREWRTVRYDPFQTRNLQVLCCECHSRKTRSDNGSPVDSERLEWVAYVKHQHQPQQQPMRKKSC